MKATGLCVLFSIVVILFATGCANQLLLHPETARRAFEERPVDPLRYGDDPTICVVTNKLGNRLTGWVFSSPTNKGVSLIGDGNATGIAQTYAYNRYLLHHGWNVVFLSYQGFDSNEGSAEVRSLAGDVETFYGFCQARFPNQPIVLVAESISTAPCFCFASRHPEIAGLVLEAMVDPKTVAFSKINDWWFFYPFYPLTICAACLVSDSIPNDLSPRNAQERHPEIPALFIHHPKDGITPYRTALKIYERYEGPKEWITLEAQTAWPAHMIASFDPEATARILAFIKRNLDRSLMK